MPEILRNAVAGLVGAALLAVPAPASAGVAAVGPPGAPTAVVAFGSLGSATVAWTAPASDGGAPISTYTAQAYQSGVPVPTRTCTTAGPSCAVFGLISGIYSFRVTAYNGTATGAESADSNLVMINSFPIIPLPGFPLPSIPNPSLPVPSQPDPSLPDPSLPVPSLPVPSLPDPSLPVPSLPVPSLPNPSLPVPSVPVVPVVPPVFAPDAPGSAPTVRAGTSSVAVSWPASNGQVTDYTATASPGGNSCTSSSTTCVIGAEAGTAYTVTVVARGPGGNSAPSAASAGVTPTAPVAPPFVPDDVPATLTTDRGQLSLALPNQEITVIGAGFAPNSTTKVILYSTPVVLGTATTDAAGAFSLSVTMPATTVSGDHTLLAQGVDANGTTRRMALPVTVPPTSPNTSGTGDQNQIALPVPSGGAITLLDDAGTPVSTVSVTGQGTYALDPATGTITFAAVPGFTGRATPVRYRITDSVGSVVTGSYTAVVTGAPGAVRLPLPARLITKVDGTALIRVTHGAAVSGRSTVALWSTVAGRRVSFGSATGVAARTTVVPVPLNALGRTMTARPGGYPVTAAVTTTLADGRDLRATALTRVVLQHFPLPRPVYFGSDSTRVGTGEAAYLAALRAKLGGVRALTCVGHTDSRGTAGYARKTGLLRAQAVCRALATGLGIRTIIISRGKATTGNDTEAGKARNRRTDVTLHY